MLATQPTSAAQHQGQALRGAIARLDAGPLGRWYSSMAAWGWGYHSRSENALRNHTAHRKAIYNMPQS